MRDLTPYICLYLALCSVPHGSVDELNLHVNPMFTPTGANTTTDEMMITEVSECLSSYEHPCCRPAHSSRPAVKITKDLTKLLSTFNFCDVSLR